jgi:DNA polymerase-3 subunit epsilon
MSTESCFRWFKKKNNDDKTNTWTGKISKNTPFVDCPFVVFDMELSGLDAKKDFIISIGAIKMTGSTINISKEFYRMIKPSGTLSRENVAIHGMTPSELENQEDIDKVLPAFLEFIADSVLVGHFVNIDLKFINKHLKRRGLQKLSNPALDTHSIHEWLSENGQEFRKHYHGSSGKTDLFSIAKRYDITIDTLHNALSDSFVTAQLFQKFLYFLHAEGMHGLNEVIKIGRA